jgi:hypothetical protein
MRAQFFAPVIRPHRTFTWQVENRFTPDFFRDSKGGVPGSELDALQLRNWYFQISYSPGLKNGFFGIYQASGMQLSGAGFGLSLRANCTLTVTRVSLLHPVYEVLGAAWPVEFQPHRFQEFIASTMV